MYSMNKVMWDKPVKNLACAASCCVKISIGVSKPVN